MKCWLVSADLMFGAAAEQAVRQAGYEPCVVTDLRAVSDASLEGLQLVLADLNAPGFDAQATAELLRSRRGGAPRMIAVGPHVHHAKLAAARAAGWQVVTRGQFHSSAQQILQADG